MALLSFAGRYGPWALVAGASEGLGAAFAEALAARGLNLILVARRAEVLEQVAAPLRARVAVETCALDLARPDLADALAGLVGDKDVGLCVYNAAHSPLGPFLEQTLDDKLRAIDVNCRGPVIAAHVLGPRLAARGRGGLLLMSSLTAFWGSPLLATYGATRAFNLSFGEALWFELGPRGVDVLVCCPGATRTPGFERTAPPDGPRAMAPAAVVAEALAALGRGRPGRVAGLANRLAVLVLARLLPRRRAVAILARATARLNRPPG